MYMLYAVRYLVEPRMWIKTISPKMLSSPPPFLRLKGGKKEEDKERKWKNPLNSGKKCAQLYIKKTGKLRLRPPSARPTHTHTLVAQLCRKNVWFRGPNPECGTFRECLLAAAAPPMADGENLEAATQDQWGCGKVKIGRRVLTEAVRMWEARVVNLWWNTWT